MICLTGDIHHASLKTGNQQHCDISEIQCAQIYNKMLKDANVKVTYFISGKCFVEEWDDLKEICESDNVEIGGHNYDCFQHTLWHRVWNKLIDSYNGPRWYQKRDVLKTAKVIKDRTNRDLRVWRNHMYMHGKNTESILHSAGIKICSDGVKKESNGLIKHPSGIYNFHLNIIPDHEHLIHAERTPEWIEWWQKRYNWSDDFGSESYYIEEWTDMVLKQLEENEKNGVISNMIIHPITMYLCDKFTSFQRILDFLKNHDTIWMTELLDMQREKHE